MASNSIIDQISIMCPICLDVFVEPITLICNHELCKQCYDQHFAKADFRCPMCKKRLSAWARRAVAKGSLINQSKWKYIQENFSHLLEKRLNGEETYSVLAPTHLLIAESGEVHKEYLKMKDEFEKEQQAEREEEESASLKLIQQIIKNENEEAERIRQEQMARDEELANVISTQLNQPISPQSVSKKLLRSVTSSNKKRKAISATIRSPRHSIEKFCVYKRSYDSEKENRACNNVDAAISQPRTFDTFQSDELEHSCSALSSKRQRKV